MKHTAQKQSRGRLSNRLTARVSPALYTLAHQYSDPSTSIRIALVLLALELNADMSCYQDDVRALLAERLEPELIAILHPLYLSLIQAYGPAMPPANTVSLRHPAQPVQRLHPSVVGGQDQFAQNDVRYAENLSCDIPDLHIGFEV